MRFIGEIRRQDLIFARFIQSAAASRDLALYKELALATSITTPSGKVLRPGSGLSTCLRLPARAGAVVADLGFGDGEPMRLKVWVASESPSRLTHPDLTFLQA